MPVGVSLTIFIALIAVLSALRSQLVYELSGLSMLLFGRARPGVWFYSLLVLPGTILHELSHWLVAEILQVRTGEITILPNFDTEGGRERLGSVETARSDPLRGFLIGLAPFVTGLAILMVLGHLFTLELLWWQYVLTIYGVVVIGNSMMISAEDRRTWPFILILLLLLTFIFVYLDLSIPARLASSTTIAISNLNVVLGMTSALNLVIIYGSYFLRRLVEKVTRRRIL